MHNSNDNFYFLNNVISREAERSKALLDINDKGDRYFPLRPDWQWVDNECSCGHNISAIREDGRVYCLACTRLKDLKGALLSL